MLPECSLNVPSMQVQNANLDHFMRGSSPPPPQYTIVQEEKAIKVLWLTGGYPEPQSPIHFQNPKKTLHPEKTLRNPLLLRKP
jgi:hypothetical protein